VVRDRHEVTVERELVQVGFAPMEEEIEALAER
jgi:hypothetical protein